ncbi:hypothetical protein F5I97DRAFT_651795 [Phlebopus sp. FC_14]|nr:hypothetical protein F5I97DRAFT_651795 [Phlebopus sp. FC_14]
MSALTSLSTPPSSPAATSAAVSTSAAPPPPSSTSAPPPSSSPSPTSASPTSSLQQSPTSAAPTSSNPSSNSSSVGASTSASSSASASASAPTSSASTPTSVAPSTSQFLTSSGAVVETVTTVVTPTASITPSPANNSSSSSNSFWHNTGAVAGVFTVVGLVVVAIFVALVTNAVRRRRAQKFDRDVAEAAAEAAASSRSPFDDYQSYQNTSPGGGYGYSDNSHGTFRQPPMAPQNDAYGMSEMSRYDPYAAAGAAGMTAAAALDNSRMRKDTLPGAPGIAGVGAGSLGREPSRRDPYHAFAGPGPQPHEMMDNTPYMRSPANQDALEAAALAGAATMADNGAFLNRRPSDYTQQTHHSIRSQGYGSSPPPPPVPEKNYPAPMQYGYQPEAYPQRGDTRSADPFATYSTMPYPQSSSPSPGLPNPHGSSSPSPPAHHSDGAFGGEHSMEDFHDEGSPTALRGEEERMSFHDEDDVDQGNRVLRVRRQPLRLLPSY